MGSEAPVISVVIPFGKLDGNIARCVQSALEQTTPPLEVIVVANHVVSVEAARRTLQSLIYHPALYIVDGAACRNANDARNLGATLAKGSWLALLDSDDWWDSAHLSNCTPIIQSADPLLDLVYGSITVHKSDGIVVLPAHHYGKDGSAENYLLSYYPAQTSTYVVRREAILEEPWDPALRRHQDYEWFARIARRNRVIVNPEPTVHVEWLTGRRHKAHRDCWKVVKAWRPLVRRAAFRRHHKNLLKSAVHSRDIFAIHLALSFFLDFFRPQREFMNSFHVLR